LTSTSELTARYAEVAAPGSIVIREQLPPAPGPEQVLVQVEFCGLCSSDLGYVRGSRVTAGTRFGHEVVGLVVDGNALVRPGRYAVQTSQGFSAWVLARPADLVPVPDTLDPVLGALAEPVACSVLAVERSVRPAPPQTALVLGAGFMGLTIIRLLTARGIAVRVADPDVGARAEAVRFGAVSASDPASLEGESGTDLVIECVGSQAALDIAVRHVAIGGVISIVGYHQAGGGSRTLDLRTLNFRGADLINAHERNEARIGGAMSRALLLMSSGILDVKALIAGIVPLAELPSLVASRDLRGKYVVRCSD
jgi:threonine dehydrogenase-like Zn-dependent dehydrogenase